MSLVKTDKNGDGFPSLFTGFFDDDNFFSDKWFDRQFKHSLPALNVKEGSKEFDIELAAPGFKKSDFKITSEDDVLTISAEKKEEKSEKKKHYTRQEFSYNSFTRSLRIPDNSIPDKLVVSYEDGLLKLILPKKEASSRKEKKEFKVL